MILGHATLGFTRIPRLSTCIWITFIHMPTSNFFDVGAMAPKAPRSSEWLLLRLAPCKNVQKFTCQLTGCMAIGSTPAKVEKSVSWRCCRPMAGDGYDWIVKNIRWTFCPFSTQQQQRCERKGRQWHVELDGVGCLFVPHQWTPSSRGVDKVSCEECLFQKPFSSALLGWKGEAPNVTAWNIVT